MNAKEFAQMLNGREMGEEMTREEEHLAKASGLVVVFGYSDDGTDFKGAINDEVGSWSGAKILLDKDGIVEDCDCKYGKIAKESAKVISAKWNDNGPFCWTYETDIPHESFEIFEDGEPFCRGIVFNISDLK